MSETELSDCETEFEDSCLIDDVKEMKAHKGKGMGEWEVGRILQETAKGDPDMKTLQEKNFVSMYKKMVDIPSKPIAANIVRGNGLPFLSETFDEKELEALKQKFENNSKSRMTKKDLRRYISDAFGNCDVLEHYDKIFNLMDLDLDGVISWEEMIGFLEVEMLERYQLVNGYLPASSGNYIDGPTKEIPNRHNKLIAGITFWPSINKERKIEAGVGKYISVSITGEVDFFNLNMAPGRHELAPSPPSEGCRAEVKALCVLPDLNIICLGTVARDLRFYEFKIDKMECVYHITNLGSHPVGLVYKFYENPSRKSLVAVGMMDGSVATLLFRTDDGGPFRKASSSAFVTHSYQSIRMGSVEGMEARDFKNLHSHWIESISYIDALDCLMTTSNIGAVSLALLDVEERCIIASLEVPHGVTCAALLPAPPHLSALPLTNYENDARRGERRVLDWWLVTGGVDTRIRIWDLNNTSRPRCTLTGHISRVKVIIVEHDPVSDCPLIISYGRIGRIHVWNARTFEKIQLYSDGLRNLTEDKPVTIYYNSYYHVLLLCTHKILYLKIGRFVDKCISSGNTENEEIVATLYNKQYDVVITATLGSTISRWNPETGDNQLKLTNCHISRSVRGEEVAGISAAALNPEGNLLATGAVDGSIKLWNFYKGVAVKDLVAAGPVRWIFWRRGGMLLVSNDGKARLFSSRPLLNSDYTDYLLGNDVTAAAFVNPSYLVVGTLAGDLIFADFATGNHIMRFHVDLPREKTPKNAVLDWNSFHRCGGSGKISVEAIYFLKRRKVEPGIGNLLVSLRTGVVQLWSTHPGGGYLDCFYAVHLSGDKVAGFASDKNHNFLFTGTSYGYLKTWWIGNFGMGSVPGRLIKPGSTYPYLSPDLADSLPARVASRERHVPTLLNCYRAHAGSLSIILFLQSSRIVMTAAMKSVRYWTLTGQFLNSFGCTLEWIYHSLAGPVRPERIRIPSDLKRIVSNTSLKVLKKDYTFITSSESVKSAQSNDNGEDDDEKEIVREKEEIVIPWQRADLKDLWGRVEQVNDDVGNVPPIPDLAQEQLYQNMMLHKTEKVIWIKPPKIVRSKRKRIALTVLHDDKKECCECESKAESNGRQHNKNISLTEGVNLLDEKMKHKEQKEICKKCYWKTQDKKYKRRIDLLFDPDLLGSTQTEMTQNFGSLAVAAAAQSFGDAYLFGKLIPKSKSELTSFISTVMELKGINDTPQNRKLIMNLIELEKKKAVVKCFQEFKDEDEKDLLIFDCLTSKEKTKTLKRVRKELGEHRKADAEKHGRIPGIYSFLSNCLYDTEYAELPDHELMKVLVDLSKRLNKDKVEKLGGNSYKKRFGWWMKTKGSNTWDAAKKIVPVSKQVKQFVRSITSETCNMDSLKDNFYENITGHVINILDNLTCPQCGGKMNENKKVCPENKVFESHVPEERESETRQTFNVLLKNCLTNAPLGEIREEDAVNQLCKFFNKIISNILPCCLKCMGQNFLDPNYSIHKEKGAKLLKTVDQAVEFCMPLELPSQQEVSNEYFRAQVNIRKKKACDRMEREIRFQKEKEININNHERRLDGLKKRMVSILGHDTESVQKRSSIKQEIAETQTEILEEYKRKSKNKL